jgi:hypothetical protein
MLVKMRGSTFLAVLAFPLAGCSVLLDWNDYSGGTPDAANVDMPDLADSTASDAAEPVTDASVVVDVASPADVHEAQASALDTGAEEESPEAAGPTCDVNSCPTASCNITVYFHACCLPDGGCGCQSTIPNPGICM